MSKKKTKQIKYEVKQETSEAKIYIGRSLPGLTKNTIFKGGQLPPYVAELADKNESVAGLIVPVSALQEARKNIQTKGHILNYYSTKQSKEV